MGVTLCCWISLTPSYIAYSACRMPAPECYLGGTSTSMRRRCSGSFTGCPLKAVSSTKYCYSLISSPICMIWALSTNVTCSTATCQHGDFGLLASCSSVDPWCGPPTENVHSHNYAAPTLWNALPLLVRACTSFAHFKVSLKTHLFVEYFNGLFTTVTYQSQVRKQKNTNITVSILYYLFSPFHIYTMHK